MDCRPALRGVRRQFTRFALAGASDYGWFFEKVRHLICSEMSDVDDERRKGARGG
jgi:hypothetical protein